MRLRKALIGTAATLALAAGTVAVAAPAYAGPEFEGSFPTESECIAAGEAGVDAGEWTSYSCLRFEGVWDLYSRG